MKVAVSGSHGVGKTTDVFRIAHDYKMAYPNSTVKTLTEVARESPLSINETSSKESQLWIFTNQISREVELGTKYDILICDRTIVDCIGYSLVLGYTDLAHAMISIAETHMASYDLVYFKKIANNDYLVADGVRSVDLVFRKNVETAIEFVYRELMDKGATFELIER